jgi:hypothetical protein
MFCCFVGSIANCYENIWDCGEGKVSLLRHINRKFIVNVYQVVKFRKTMVYSGDMEYRECIRHFGWEMF